MVKKSKDKAGYVRGLVQYVAENRITLEICLSSNLQTMPLLLGDAANHSFVKMLESRLSVCLCTDNRLVHDTCMVKEMRLAADTFKLTPKQLKDIVIGSFKRSFNPLPYPEKRAYVRKVIDWYEQLEREHGVVGGDA
jgi:adenosine deaminase